MKKKSLLILIATATMASMAIQTAPLYSISHSKSNKLLLSSRKISNSNYSDKISNYGITKNSITLIGNWGDYYKTDVFNFNPSTQRINISGSMGAYFGGFSGDAFKVVLYNQSGSIIKSETYEGSNTAQDLYNGFNNLEFQYGDIIQITPLGPVKTAVSNFDGESTYETSKAITMEIEQDGLKSLGSNIKLNKIYYTLNSNKVDVGGTTTPNTKVNINVDDKVYTTTSNSKGTFNLNINADKNITATTNIEVYAEGEQIQKVTPILNPNIYGITKNSITLIGNWGDYYKTDVFNFNPSTKRINISGSMGAYFGGFSGDAFKVVLYNQSGSIIKSETYEGSNTAQDLYNGFNNLEFQYGDILQITPIGPVKTAVSNFDGESTYETSKAITMEIEQDGLKSLGSNIKLNKIYYTLNSNKTEVSGVTEPNTEIYINIDNKVYTTTSNSKGTFNLNINADKNITATTNIEVYVEGEQIQKVTPMLNPNIYGIIKNKIIINNFWNQSLGTISFNAITKKMEFVNGWAAVSPYFSGEAFSIGLYSSNGSLIKSLTVNAGESPENALNDVFNNTSFSYGDMVKIGYKTSSKISISNFNNEKNYQVTKNTLVKITENGLEKCSMPSIKVNPFAVLGAGSVNSGVLTGLINSPNEKVNIIVNNKTFSGISNSKGEFSIKISDDTGFTSATKILVETKGQLTTCINPTAIPNLGIEKSTITASGTDYDGTYAQVLSFNPATMTIANSDCGVGSTSFSAQLIDGKTGNVIASCATDTFNAFKSNNNINGAKFQYGDIIAVYESEETELSLGELSINNKNSKNALDCTNKFKCFEITPEGLVPVANKNLITSKALYTGAKNVDITGKTIPNTDVTISFGSESKVVKSNSNGEFDLDIPFSELYVGSEIRVFVNNENTNILTVQYDTKLISLNTNKIEVLNNEGVPVFNVDFNPVSNKFEAVAYPLDKTYAGAFYGNDLNIKVINPKNGEVVYNFSGNKLNDINNFISQINNKSYNLNDIIEVSYNPSFVTANVYNGKDSIGNSTGKSEYFKITNKGLVNLSDKFISVNSVGILNGSEVTKTSIEGTVNPNSSVEISVNGKVFKGEANSKGEFNIPVIDENGFTSSTNIVISSDGYIPTTVNPTVNSKDKLMSSYINFYKSKGEYGNLVSSIGFNPGIMKFVVNNYSNSFGNGSSKYFNLTLYNMNGNEILKGSINNGSTAQLSNLLNNKAFSYGDIIGLSYNISISKPVVLNGNSAIGNISGQEEYFEITKDGLVKVNFGENAKTSNVYFDGNNLVINSTLANGQSENTLKANKKLVILNSNNNIVASVNTSELNNNSLDTQGIINETILSKLQNGQEYSFALEINNKLYPINVESTIEGNSKYTLEANENNQLEISVAKEKIVNINNSMEIGTYLKGITKSLNVIASADLMNNLSNQNKVLAGEFINRIGLNNIENFYNESKENANFINWVLNDSTAMEEFLGGPSPDGTIPEGQPSATYSQSLQVWSNIWNAYTNSHEGFNLKLAIAVALTNGQPISSFPSGKPVGSPVQRYNIFEALNVSGGMLPEFGKLDVSHLCYVVNTPIANNQIKEMRNIILQNHNGLITPGELNNIAYTINYNETNPHTGASVFGNNFYGPNPKINAVWYDGGVCGAVGRMGECGEQVFGIPAAQTPQPGHNAFIYYDSSTNQWYVGNDVFGWAKTYDADMSGWSNNIAPNKQVASYTMLYQKADTKSLAESNLYLYLADSENGYANKINAINEAIKIQPLNLGAWLEKIKLMNKNPNTTLGQYEILLNEVINTFNEYPMPMVDTILQFNKQLLEKGTEQDYNKLVEKVVTALNNVTNATEKPIAQSMLINLSKWGLSKNMVLLASNYIDIINGWGTNNAADINFNTKTMQFKVSGSNPYLGYYNTPDFLNIKIYSLKENKYIYSYQFKGSDGANVLATALDGKSFNYGDIIALSYDAKVNGSAVKVYNSNNENIGNDTGRIEYFKITPMGLIKVNSINDTTKIAIEGANNKIIDWGSSFNNMAGIKLNDQADPNAKISVSGAVNTKVPGVYKLTYTVKDSYGQTATVTREITVKSENKMVSNTEDLYWNGNSLIINGNIDSESTFTHSIPKKLVIMNSKEQVIDSVNTTAVNWYSSNKDDYSGFQCTLPASILSKLVLNNTYGLYMDVNGDFIPLISKGNSLYNKNYLLSSNSSNQLTIAKNDGTIKTINEGTGSYIVGYFINNGYVINGNISLNNEVFGKGNTRILLVKNAEGKIVDSINCAAMNWYSSNKDNYSSFQGIIPNSILNKLGTGDSYTLSLEVIKDGQTYEMPINNTKHFILSNGVNYNITTNSKNNITITKAQSDPVVNEGTSSLQSGYWEPYGYVMNIKADIGKEIPKGTQMELISKNLNGQIVSVTPGVDVNWYSSNKDNYNGFQAMITSKQLVEASTSNKLYVRVTIDGKTYESPVTGNLDTFGTGNLHYGFKTINNQINLIMK